MPLLFGTDRKKLSKRHGATNLGQLTAMGFLVGVVRNYLCFLSTEFDETMIGWTLDDLVGRFDVEKLSPSPSIFDPDKLRWMNGRAIREMGDEELGERLVAYLTRIGFYGDVARLEGLSAAGPQALAAVVEGAESAAGHQDVAAVRPTAEQDALTRVLAPFVREKMDVLADFVPMTAFFFRPLAFTEEAKERLAGTPEAGRTLREAAVRLAAVPVWHVEAIEDVVRGLPEASVSSRSRSSPRCGSG